MRRSLAAPRSSLSGSASGTLQTFVKGLKARNSRKLSSDVLGAEWKRATELIDAGNVVPFRSWLEERVEGQDDHILTATDEMGWTLFHYACNSGRLEVAASPPLVLAPCSRACPPDRVYAARGWLQY